jgi:acetyl-CoA carboxylase biotin carboxyl carrier protein
MPPLRLVALVDPPQEPAGTRLVRAPAVGVAEGLPEPGSLLDSGGTIGTLWVFGRRFLLVLPKGACGRVGALRLDQSSAPVAYSQPLFEILHIDASAAGPESAAATTRQGVDGEAGESALIAVKSPTHGVFYRRPSADSPPYVEVGSVVEHGTVLALVEVMKCFNPVTMAGAVSDVRGVVDRVLAEDVTEVGFGQVLFLVRVEAGS